MENERVRERVEVSGNVTNAPVREGCKHIVSVHIYREFEEYLEEESGRARMMRSYPAPPPPIHHIVLKPINFTPRHLRHLLHHPLLDASFSNFLTQKIIDIAENPNSQAASPQRPLFISVFVKFTTEILLSIPTRFDSRDLFQRLAEEQRVESEGYFLEAEEEEACSICLEKLSGSEAVIEMPGCLHMFHQDCIFEWLRHQNSCPLCRRIPYDVDEIED